MAWLLLLSLACSEPPTPPAPGRIDFVRGGVITQGVGAEGTRIGDGRRLVARAWQPGVAVVVDGQSLTAPAGPACVEIAAIELGPLPGTPPGLRFTPDGALELSLGAERWAVEAWTGRVTHRGPDPTPIPTSATATSGALSARVDGATVALTLDGASLPDCAAQAPLAPTVALAADGRVAGVEATPGGAARLVVWR